MSLEDLQAMTEPVDVAAAWREAEPPAPAEDDDEPDEEDAAVAATREKVFNDPEHAAQHEARMAERSRNAELGKMLVAEKSEQEAAWEREKLKHSAIASAPVLPRDDDDDDDDFWDDDEDFDDQPQRVVTPDTIRFVDQLVMSGASPEDLAEVGEAIGHDVVSEIVQYRVNERNAAIAAHQQAVQAQETAQYLRSEFGPELAAEERWKQVARSLTPEQQARGIAILQGVTVTSPEQGRQAAEMAARAAIDEDRRVRDRQAGMDNFNERLLRAMESVSPSSMLDPATGESLYYATPEPVDAAFVVTGESDTPGHRKQQGLRFAKRAESFMDAAAKHRDDVAKSNADGLRRALKLQEKEEARGMPARKFT